ncbi:site-specific integrase [Ferruginibacter paludis]|uniref:tyrosine-type recombinase/integrase n=1 Tax=Ferruginibacter paludis TaxID=1310417 RepID=UPI0025B3937C|nr:site-specific integrase [Ferruginibacter paludis]MDN3659492.1 site-specific integrase [Ferruginibacter paludis]
MKKKRVNVQVVPDYRRNKNEGRFPLKLRVTYKSERKYYSTGYSASLDEWELINSSDAKGKLRKIKLDISGIENDAQKCCDEITSFSFKQFEYLFFDERIIFKNVRSSYTAYMDQLVANDQYATSITYRTALRRLEKYHPDLKFEDITVEFLSRYESWELSNGKSITTIGINLRTLRAIMNLAKENGTISVQQYPFGKRKYTIPTSKNIKKALTIEQIKKIFDYPAPTLSPMEKAKDIWIFSYLCNGINLMDIAHLQWKNIETNCIHFVREKTKRKQRANPKIITALRNEHVNRIISKWGNHESKQDGDDFVFGILSAGDTAKDIRRKVQQFIQTNNLWTKKIGVELGFSLALTSYVARHSFATILVRGGAPIEFASQSLGHANILTTQQYFAGFDLAKQAEYVKALTDFKI